jgi:hypothetical protein
VIRQNNIGPRALGPYLTITTGGLIRAATPPKKVLATKQEGTFLNQRLYVPGQHPSAVGRRRGQDVPSTSTPYLGGLGGQVRLVPNSTNSKNPLEHLPPRWQEHSGIEEKAMEAPTNPDESTFSAGGLVGHVILPLM